MIGYARSASAAARAKNGRKVSLLPVFGEEGALDLVAERRDLRDVDLDDGGELRRRLHRDDGALGDDLAQARHRHGRAAQRRRPRGARLRRAAEPTVPRRPTVQQRPGGLGRAARQHVLLADASADTGAGDGRQVDALLVRELAHERSDVPDRRAGAGAGAGAAAAGADAAGAAGAGAAAGAGSGRRRSSGRGGGVGRLRRSGRLGGRRPRRSGSRVGGDLGARAPRRSRRQPRIRPERLDVVSGALVALGRLGGAAGRGGRGGASGDAGPVPGARPRVHLRQERRNRCRRRS